MCLKQPLVQKTKKHLAHLQKNLQGLLLLFSPRRGQKTQPPDVSKIESSEASNPCIGQSKRQLQPYGTPYTQSTN